MTNGLLGGSEDFCEDEMEFFGFLPDGFGRVAQFKDSADEHPSEKLGFPRFLFAGADLVAELFFGTESSASQ